MTDRPWLVKSPPSLFSHISSLPDGTTFGTLTFKKKPASDPQKKKQQGQKKRKNEFLLSVDTWGSGTRRYKLNGITDTSIPAMHIFGPSEGNNTVHQIHGTVVRLGAFEPDNQSKDMGGYMAEVGARNRIFEENRGNIVRSERGAVEDDKRMIESRMGDTAFNLQKLSKRNNDTVVTGVSGDGGNGATNGKTSKKSGAKFTGDASLPTLTKADCMNFVFNLYQIALENVARLEDDLASSEVGVELTPAQKGYFTFNEVCGEIGRQWNVGEGGQRVVREVLQEIAELHSSGKFRGRWGLKNRAK